MDTNIPPTNSSAPIPAVPGTPPVAPAAATLPPDTSNFVLNDQQRTQLDGIVNQMVQNKEPDHAIQFVVSDFKSKYGQPAQQTNSAPTAPVSPLPFVANAQSDGKTYSPLSAEGETNLGNALGNIFPGKQLGTAVGNSAYSISQLLAGAYHTITGNHDKAAENYNNALGGASSGADINKAFADAIQTGLTVLPGAGEGLSTTAKAATGAATGYGFDVTNNLKNNGEVGNTDNYKPGLGTAVGGILPFATVLTGALAKGVTGFTSGTGAQVLQRAIDNPDAVNAAVKTYADTPELKQSLVDRARGAISDYIANAQGEYRNAVKDLATQAPLQLNVANQSFADNIAKFGGSITDEGDVVFKNSALTSQDQKNLQNAYKTISNWTDSSPQGMDNLRQSINNLMDDYKIQGNPRANTILGNVKSDLTGHIAQSTPGYQDMLDQFGKKTQTASSIIKELNLGGNARASTQLNSVMRLFQRDPSIMEKVSTIMGPENADKFMNELSGAILSDWIPAGKMGNYIRGYGELATLGAGTTTAAVGGAGLGTAAATGVAAAAAPLATMSPRIVGTGARLAGRAAQAGVGPALRRVATYLSSKVSH